MAEEIEPYVVYRIEGAQMECALWQFREGPKALALFLSGDAATSYIEAVHTVGDWKIFRPTREVLLQLLGGCQEAGVRYAVLDPDQQRAKRIFDIEEILQARPG